jgi:hypothetical protein
MLICRLSYRPHGQDKRQRGFFTALYPRSVCWSSTAFRGLGCHLLACIYLNLRCTADSNFSSPFSLLCREDLSCFELRFSLVAPSVVRLQDSRHPTAGDHKPNKLRTPARPTESISPHESGTISFGLYVISSEPSREDRSLISGTHPVPAFYR